MEQGHVEAWFLLDFWESRCVVTDKCRALWKAVLVQAVKDALEIGDRSLGSGPHTAYLAKCWFRRKRDMRDGSWPFVISALDLSPEQVRTIEQLVRHPCPRLLQLIHTSRYNTLVSVY